MALLALALFAGGPQAQDDDGAPSKRSLESLLERARAQERVLLERLAEPVRLAVRALEEAVRPEEQDAARVELLALGPESSPLLVAHLAPGDEPTAAQRRRATAVGDALRAWGAPGITEQLVQLTLGGDDRARTQAARVLSHVDEPARARAVFAELLAGELQGARLDGARGFAELAERGDAESIPPLRALLFETSALLLTVSLDGLAAVSDAEAEPDVRRLVADPARAVLLTPQLETYYTAIGDADRAPVCIALAKAAAAEGLETDSVRTLLGLIARLEPPRPRELVDALEVLVERPEPEIQDEGRICLALLGDRGARRALIRKYDDWVESRETWSSAYRDRARIAMRIREYADAAKDLETAIDLTRSRNEGRISDLYVELARARCLDGKLRRANEALGKAYLSKQRLQQLAADPDFQALAEHSRYGRIFGD